MKGKILIVSVFAVALIVLASCNSVVGSENAKETLNMDKEQNVEKVEQIFESVEEKSTLLEEDDPEAAIWFPGMGIIGFVWVCLIVIWWIICGCPPPPILP